MFCPCQSVRIQMCHGMVHGNLFQSSPLTSIQPILTTWANSHKHGGDTAPGPPRPPVFNELKRKKESVTCAVPKMEPLRQPKNQMHLLRRICLPTARQMNFSPAKYSTNVKKIPAKKSIAMTGGLLPCQIRTNF